MIAVELIVTALTAGMTAGVTATTSAAVQDIYTSLRAAVRRRLAGEPEGEEALEEHARDPEAGGERLLIALRAVRAGEDPEIAEAARRLLDLVGPERPATYSVRMHDVKGVQIGDGNVQNNTF